MEPLVSATIDELIDGATDRVVVNPEDGKSGSDFELLTIDGERMFLKVVSYDRVWFLCCLGFLLLWVF